MFWTIGAPACYKPAVPVTAMSICLCVQGFLYVLNCEGQSMPGWPLQMGDIQAQVAVGDIDSDGYLELVAADARGNVAAFTWKAEELWERHVASLVSQVCLPLGGYDNSPTPLSTHTPPPPSPPAPNPHPTYLATCPVLAPLLAQPYSTSTCAIHICSGLLAYHLRRCSRMMASVCNPTCQQCCPALQFSCERKA